MVRRFYFLIPLAFFLASLVLSGCSTLEAKHDLKMSPMSEMPEDVQKSPLTVQQSYQFAVANPDIVKGIPCYCGCGSVGHKSNYQCYVKSDEGGKVEFDQHALGCSICVDITQDAMRLTRQGKSIKEIKAYIDASYSKFGPSNMDQ